MARIKVSVIIVMGIFVLACWSLLQAGEIDRVQPDIILFQQGQVLESFSGYGFSQGAFAAVVTIGSSNPAAMVSFQKFSAAFAYQYDTKISPFILDKLDIQRRTTALPQSLGIVYPYHALRLGAAFNQRYNERTEFKDEIRTIQHPQGTGEYYSLISNRVIKYAAIMGSYQFRGIFSRSDYFSTGLQANLNFYNEEGFFDDRPIAKISDNSPNFRFGLLYATGADELKNISIGAYFETKTSFSGTLEYEGIQVFQDSVSGNGTFRVTGNSEVKAFLPARLGAGFFVPVSSLFSFAFDFNYTWWSSVNKFYRNTINFNNSFIFNLSGQFSLSAGYYFLQDRSQGSTVAQDEALYLNAGMVYRWRMLELHFALADSHLFSGEYRKQTLLKFALGMSL